MMSAKLILATHAPKEFGTALTTSKREGTSIVDAERQAFGLAHDGIGGYLLALWGIPQTIVEAVAFHHQPDRLMDKELDAAAVTYVANTLADEESRSLSEGRKEQFFAFLDSLGLSDRVEKWREAIDQTKEQEA